ncbi:MAG: hypothetical protein R2860_00815 [Desulfobacterales bacterium]
MFERVCVVFLTDLPDQCGHAGDATHFLHPFFTFNIESIQMAMQVIEKRIVRGTGPGCLSEVGAPVHANRQARKMVIMKKRNRVIANFSDMISPFDIPRMFFTQKMVLSIRIQLIVFVIVPSTDLQMPHLNIFLIHKIEAFCI